MLSTFEILPTNQNVLSGVKIPIITTVEPLEENSNIITTTLEQIPRCSRCSSYLSSTCAISSEAWCCSVCSQIMKLKKSILKELYSSNVVEVIENGECQPLMHSLMIFSPIKSIIKQYLSLLPSNAPISIITYTNQLNIIPTATVSLIIEEFDQIPIPEQNIPFEKIALEIIPFLKNVSMPIWHRIFIQAPISETKTHPILSTISSLYKELVRIDFYFLNSSYSPILTDLVQKTPGISRIFCLVNESELPSSLFSDADREFGFQLLAVFRAGVSYGVKFLPSSFLPSEICENYIRIPILPSKNSTLRFLIIPPKEETFLRYQSMQCVVKFSRWNPLTNKISFLFRIISQEFKLSNILNDILKTTCSSMLFYTWLQEVQHLPPGQQSFGIIDKTKESISIINSNEHLKSLIKMAFLAKSHPAMSTAFWDRLTMGSLLSLSSPKSVEAQFSYIVEVWDFNDNLLEEGLYLNDKRKKGDYIFIVKSFPSIFILTKNGNYNIHKNSKIELSINNFITDCLPIQIRIIQSQVDQVKELLSVDEEEGLSNFLENLGISSNYL